MVFATVDIETQSQLADAFGISSVPTLMIVRDRIVLYARPGELSESLMEALIRKVRDVDMDDVRRRLTFRRSALVDDRTSVNGEVIEVEPN